MNQLLMSQEVAWRMVPHLVVQWFEKSAATASEVRKAIKGLPIDGVLDLWYDQDEDKLILNVGDWMEPEDRDQWEAALTPLCSELIFEDEAGSPNETKGWITIWRRPTVSDKAASICRIKEAYSKLLHSMAELANLTPGDWNTAPNGPTPLAGTITGGLIGAGLGYGTGWLGEKILPRSWQQGKLRRTLALLGGGLGATPGVLSMIANHGLGENWDDPRILGGPPKPNWDERTDYRKISEEAGGECPAHIKQAIWDQGEWTTGFGADMSDLYQIPTYEFNNVIWNDPRVAGRLTPPVQAAASGLLTGASHLAGTRLVSPVDIARITAGMGSGYLSGLLAGKALGILMGMPDETQERLKNTGMWAGAIANIVPIAFGVP